MPVYKLFNWDAMKIQKQQAICKSNIRENLKQIQHNYQKGDWILIKKSGIIRKLVVPWYDPYIK